MPNKSSIKDIRRKAFAVLVLKPFLLISLIGAFQGILLSVFFFLRSKKSVATLMLGLYVLIFSVGLLEGWLSDNNRFWGSKLLLLVIANSSYLYGPLLYLFVSHLTSGISHFQGRNFIHFLPFGFFLLLELSVSLSGYNISDRVVAIIGIVQFEILVIQLLSYNTVAIKVLGRHYQRIMNTYSTIEERDLRWLRLLLIVITAIYILSFLLSHLSLFGVQQATDFFILVQVSITFSIYLMSYRALLRPGIFTLLKEVEVSPSAEVKYTNENDSIATSVKDKEQLIPEKYKKSGLKPEQAREYLETLQKLIEKTKPYKSPEINIYTMSQLLGISKNHLTQVLNEQLKMNFFEFINMHRIDEAKRLLLDPGYTHLSLQGIALESGYRSKTTFFSNFRKITGFTPLEWVRSQRNSA